MKLDTYTDEQLVELIQADHTEAFKEIYERYWNRLFSTATKKIKTKEAVEEIIQDLFTDIWIRRKTLQIQKNFSNYIYTSLKYRIFKHYHASLVRKRHIEHLKYVTSVSDNSTTNVISFNELTTALDKQVSALPNKCREIYTLSRQESFSMKEIAEKLNISTNTVENQMSKALRLIRSNLKEFIPTLTGAILYFL